MIPARAARLGPITILDVSCPPRAALATHPWPCRAPSNDEAPATRSRYIPRSEDLGCQMRAVIPSTRGGFPA